MRVGIFGGTFDPPHVGHQLAASDAYEALALDRVVFIPARTQPLKDGSTQTPAADRLAMIRLMADGDSRFAVDPIEIDRPGLSFMVETLQELQERRPGDERFLIVGDDVLESFGRWRAPEVVLRLATLAVLRRPGTFSRRNDMPPAVSDLLRNAEQDGHATAWLETRLVDVSSTEVRERTRTGLPLRGFVPDSVAAYIAASRLYR